MKPADSFCKYHPDQQAQYVCHQCELACCDDCAELSDITDVKSCPLCGAHMEFLGDLVNAEPFWRRLDKSFKYPVGKETLLLITMVAVGSAVLANIGSFMTFILMLLLAGVMMKYSFVCMLATANGYMQAPPIAEALTGGVRLIISLTIMIIVMVALVFTAYGQLGRSAASVLGLFYLVCFPAVLMNYALSERILSSINPINVVKTLRTIGLPYALLLAFLAMMSASVATIQGLIGDSYGILTVTLQSMVSDYYMIVVFHVMGYMLFINQRGFGYEARREDDEITEPSVRTPEQKQLAKVALLVKEGDFPQAFNRLRDMVTPQSSERVYQHYFELAFAIRSVEQLRHIVPLYMGYLIRRDKKKQIYDIYRKTLHVDKDFLPETPVGCHQLAQICLDNGHPEVGIRLVNGLHRRFPDYDRIKEAYLLMADLLEMIPKVSHKAPEYRALARKFAV